jgi:membrane protein
MAFCMPNDPLVATLTFGLIYKILPNTQIAWRDVWLGALIAAVLMALGGLLVEIYLTSNRFNTALEAAGTFAVLLIGIYYLAQIFLLGAVFNRAYVGHFGSKKEPSV